MRRRAALLVLAGLALTALPHAGAKELRGEHLPLAARAQARTGEGVVGLRAPGPSELRLRGGHFTMGSEATDVAAAREACAHEPRGAACANRELFPALFADELDAHPVVLSDFWIDRTEVTVGAYGQCVEAGACTALRQPGAKAWTRAADLPMTLVTWDDAARFCTWRGARLPTEAEWERAARGWAGRTYPWGHVLNPKLCNHGRFAWDPLDDDDGFAELAPVGSFPAGATPEGVVDLAGNVEEWVADWYAPGYGSEQAVDPRGPESGELRVVRGGSYQSGRPWLRAAARSYDVPARRRSWRGFRCARSASPW